MTKYRKKPVVIEAVQLRNDNLQEVNAFLGVTLNPNTYGLKIDTLEGQMTASDGDFIIRGVKGEFYPCKPDIFDATYEKVDD